MANNDFEKIPKELLERFLRDYNDDRYRRDASRTMRIKYPGGQSTGLKLFLRYDIPSGSRVFFPDQIVTRVIDNLNFNLRIHPNYDRRENLAPKFQLREYKLRAGQGFTQFEIMAVQV